MESWLFTQLRACVSHDQNRDNTLTPTKFCHTKLQISILNQKILTRDAFFCRVKVSFDLKLSMHLRHGCENKQGQWTQRSMVVTTEWMYSIGNPSMKTLGTDLITHPVCDQLWYNQPPRPHWHIDKNMTVNMPNIGTRVLTRYEKCPIHTNNASIRILRDSNCEEGGKEDNDEHGDQRQQTR